MPTITVDCTWVEWVRIGSWVVAAASEIGAEAHVRLAGPVSPTEMMRSGEMYPGVTFHFANSWS